MGYEGLQVNNYLSARRLIPFVEITWISKAPTWTKIDDILGKLEKHYGTCFTKKGDFEKYMKDEVGSAKPGMFLEKLGEYDVHHVCLSDQKFTEQNSFAQALLPFFIEAATPIQTCPY